MSRLLIVCLLMGALRAMAEPGCVLRLDFEGDAAKRLVCRETGVRGVAAGQVTIEKGAFRASPFGSLTFPKLTGLDGREQLSVSAWIAPAKAPSSYETIVYKGKRDADRVQQIHFFVSLCEGRPEFKFKNEKGDWHGILRNADQFVLMGSGGTLPAASMASLLASSTGSVGTRNGSLGSITHCSASPATSTPSQNVSVANNTLEGSLRKRSSSCVRAAEP